MLGVQQHRAWTTAVSGSTALMMLLLALVLWPPERLLLGEINYRSASNTLDPAVVIQLLKAAEQCHFNEFKETGVCAAAVCALSVHWLALHDMATPACLRWLPAVACD